jgi:CAAX prenyl protease-like protein
MNEARTQWPAWFPYVVPFAAFLILTMAEGWLPQPSGSGVAIGYPLAYAVKIAVVTAVAWACRSAWRDLRPLPGMSTLAVSAGVGLLVLGLWVGLDPYYPRFSWLGGRSAFDPRPLPIAWRLGFLVVRFYGLVLLVPLIEELFWRSFLIRWIIDPEFARVPIGRVTPLSALVTSALFAAAHPEWLPALLTGLLWAGLLAGTRSVAACVVSHSVANLGLGLYVLATNRWEFL